jgi:hypothetical protein
MTRISTLVGLAVVLSALPAQAEDPPPPKKGGQVVSLDECPVDWGSTHTQLGDCDQLDVTFKNGCDIEIGVRICLESPANKSGWNCGATFGVAPGAGWHWSSCNSTGEKKVWVKRANDYKHSYPKFP